METGCTWAQFQDKAKGLSNYVIKVFLFFIIHKLANMSTCFLFVIMWYCVEIDEGKKLLYQFQNKAVT